MSDRQTTATIDTALVNTASTNPAKIDPPTMRHSWPQRQGVRVVLGGLVLAVGIFAVYWRAIDAPFIFDDAVSIQENRSIRQLWPLCAGGPDYAPLTPMPHMPTSARPLVNLSFAVNYAFGSLQPSGYRAVNYAIHWACALLVWAIVARTLRLPRFREKYARTGDVLGFCAAAVWALHPLASEGVVYVTQRTESLMALFYLAIVYGGLRYWTAESTRGRTLWLAFVAAMSVLGGLSKEVIASVPAVLLLFEYTFFNRSFWSALRGSWKLYACSSLCWLVLLSINLYGPRTPLAGFGLGVTASEWWFTQAEVFWIYLKLVVWPWPLLIHYDLPYLTTFGQAWPWVIALAALALLALWLVWRRAPAGFVIVTAVAILSPTMLIPCPEEVAVERRMYLAVAPLVALLLVTAYTLLEKRAPRFARPLAVSVVAAVAVALSWTTVVRLAAYRDEVTLWQDTLTHRPNDREARRNLGIQLCLAGRRPEGNQYLRDCVRLYPDWNRGFFSLGHSYEEEGRTGDAITYYRLALAKPGEHAPANNNLGRLLSQFGQHAAAIRHFEQAIEEQPEFAAAHNNLGIEYLLVGDAARAIPSFERALQVSPKVDIYTNLASALAMAGREADAIAPAQEAARRARLEGKEDAAEQLDLAIEDLRRRAGQAP